MKKYGYTRNNRLMVVCELQKTQEGLLRKLQADAEQARFAPYFVFSALDQPERGSGIAFHTRRVDMRGKPVEHR